MGHHHATIISHNGIIILCCVQHTVNRYVDYIYIDSGINRGQVVEGRYVPIRGRLPRHKMATTGQTTSPRMPHTTQTGVGV